MKRKFTQQNIFSSTLRIYFLLVVYFIVEIVKIIIYKYYLLRFKWEFPKVMMELRGAELAVVVLLYRSPNYTSRLPYTDGATVRLISKKVIQLTSLNNVAYGDDLSMPFTITPIAQDYIDRHPKLIQNFSKLELENMYKRYNNPLY